MTQAQAQNLMLTLMTSGATFRATFDGTDWTVRASRPGNPVTQLTLSNLVAGISPSTPTVVATVDDAVFK